MFLLAFGLGILLQERFWRCVQTRTVRLRKHQVLDSMAGCGSSVSGISLIVLVADPVAMSRQYDE